ncbi:DUF3093 domain-containing protein [Corynebacterium mayonis]|uniref:DUF3093 domain-containing protein n=1 Tax=Corynebacterium mayonis TaxID=3062461 RepID=UPI00314079AF
MKQAETSSAQVLYRERQWVPWYMWFAGAALTLLLAGQFALNRNMWWFFVPLFAVGALITWFMFWLSRTTVEVEVDANGERWLLVNDASLPASVVSRSMSVPASARQNALGRQLDPAAFLVSHGWVKEHTLLVLDDPEDPTPYWLIASRDPDALLRAFLPKQHPA